MTSMLPETYSVDSIIQALQLQPHCEGGYYRRTYENSIHCTNNLNELRPISTAIYYLLQSHDFSCWHRLDTLDEMWHYYCGSPLTIYEIDEKGTLTETILGNPLQHSNAVPQYTIRAGNWFAATIKEPDSFVLTGCTVTPGFMFENLEIAMRQDLLNQFPQHKTIIEKLTRV